MVDRLFSFSRGEAEEVQSNDPRRFSFNRGEVEEVQSNDPRLFDFVRGEVEITIIPKPRQFDFARGEVEEVQSNDPRQFAFVRGEVEIGAPEAAPTPPYIPGIPTHHRSLDLSILLYRPAMAP